MPLIPRLSATPSTSPDQSTSIPSEQPSACRAAAETLLHARPRRSSATLCRRPSPWFGENVSTGTHHSRELADHVVHTVKVGSRTCDEILGTQEPRSVANILQELSVVWHIEVCGGEELEGYWVLKLLSYLRSATMNRYKWEHNGVCICTYVGGRVWQCHYCISTVRYMTKKDLRQIVDRLTISAEFHDSLSVLLMTILPLTKLV